MVVYNTRRKRRSVIQIFSGAKNCNNAEPAKKLVFAHYNNRLLRKPIEIDYESEVFQWDNAEGSETEEISG